jgi:hypothetical protein
VKSGKLKFEEPRQIAQKVDSIIGADFLPVYRLAVNFKTNCLMYETEGNMKDCQFSNKLEEWLEPQDSASHGLTERVDHDVTQTINYKTVWTVEKYVAFVNMKRECAMR